MCDGSSIATQDQSHTIQAVMTSLAYVCQCEAIGCICVPQQLQLTCAMTAKYVWTVTAAQLDPLAEYGRYDT